MTGPSASHPPRRRVLRDLPGPLGRLSIRWRLAVTSAALTLVILLGFAVVVGILTSASVRQDFGRRVSTTADALAATIASRDAALAPVSRGYTGGIRCPSTQTLTDLALSEGAVIRYVLPEGTVLCQTPRAPDLGIPVNRTATVSGYQVESRAIPVLLEVSAGPPYPYAQAVLQYARPTDEVARTQTRIRLFLILGVLGGAGVALLAGLALARRAMAPVSRLTARASEIERTRDPRGRVPRGEADDEVAELSRTFERMLGALDEARTETEAALVRQRAFVADASHELRTPLTSVLANLELLEAELRGEQRETAEAALRSSRRMRRLVGDLLLLARADTGRETPRGLVDLGGVLADAAAELQPVAESHHIELDLGPGEVFGAPDELHRLALNLLENATSHTPAGTTVRGRVRTAGPDVVLEVEDDGPGVPPELVDSLFERFVRGGGEGGGSSGLGLAIVRAVSRSHHGDVTLTPPDGRTGARFVVRLPAATHGLERPPRASGGVGAGTG